MEAYLKSKMKANAETHKILEATQCCRMNKLINE